LVYGLVAHAPTDVASLDAAAEATEAMLERTGVRGDIGTTRYVCLTDANAESIPVRRLDDLFAAAVGSRRGILIKCDVEGAELFVLTGAAALLRRSTVDLLLSVHPAALSSYGHTVDDVRAYLDGMNYDVRCIAVDHEEHWWCEPRSDQSRPAATADAKS
jgi:FkbM family methyltransferase